MTIFSGIPIAIGLLMVGGAIRVWLDLDRTWSIDQVEAWKRKSERN